MSWLLSSLSRLLSHFFLIWWRNPKQSADRVPEIEQFHLLFHVSWYIDPKSKLGLQSGWAAVLQAHGHYSLSMHNGNVMVDNDLRLFKESSHFCLFTLTSYLLFHSSSTYHQPPYNSSGLYGQIRVKWWSAESLSFHGTACSHRAPPAAVCGIYSRGGNLVIYHPGTVVWAVSESGESKGKSTRVSKRRMTGSWQDDWVDGSWYCNGQWIMHYCAQ